MPLVQKSALLRSLSPPLHNDLTDLLIDEFVSMEKRYIQRDWEPAELDGGQFCEIAARILYHQDSANLNLTKGFDDCCRYIENETATPHNIIPRHDAIHLVKVLRTAYKFRSQRGAVHISPTYKPNQMDAKLLIECVRWSMNEMIRVFWQGDKEGAAKAIREVLQFDVPCIGQFENVLLVQRTDLNAEEELMVLLHYAGENGFSRRELGTHARASASSVTTKIQKLCGPTCRQVVQLSNGNYRLTDLGSKRLREELSNKLLLT